MMVSALILDYEKSHRVVENVAGLCAQKRSFKLEIIIHDNSHSPENFERLSALKKYNEVTSVRKNKKNTGYTRGINALADKSSGEYLLIVNPDIIWPAKDTLQKLVDFLEEKKEVAMVGPRQMDPGGTRAESMRRWPKLWLQIIRRIPLRNWPLISLAVEKDAYHDVKNNEVQPVCWLQSSCVLVRRKDFFEAGKLCEDYFIFMSDPELAYELWKRKRQVWFYGKTYVEADGRRASQGGVGDVLSSWVLRQHVKEAILFQWKHFFHSWPFKN